jgi:hypothetical protein
LNREPYVRRRYGISIERTCDISGSLRVEFKPSEWPTFIHLDLFDEEWADLGLSETDLRDLQDAILAGPERAPVIPRAEGLRKIRFARARGGRGKSGAYRDGYVQLPEFGFILLVTVWGKHDKSDLFVADRGAITDVIKDIRTKISQRASR